MGGGNALSCPLSWARPFITNDEWTIKNNWGNFHEINHNFQQNAAFFIGDSHGETNQLTMASFSVLSDATRWRNLYNPTGEYTTGEWTRMSNEYALINWIKNDNYNANGKKVAGNGRPAQSGGEYEYQIYGLILFMIGTYNYVNYAKHDIATDNGSYEGIVDQYSNKKGWIQKEGGFYEILELSDYFQLDFWPVLQKYYPIWHDDGQCPEFGSWPKWSADHTWPKDYNSATKWQKQEIDRLNKSYKSFDFIGNIYASGIYMYNNKTKNFDYTNDTAAPYQIPAGRQYTFDFEKGINWLENDPNYQFSWSQLKFNSTTKLGGTLELDPENNKRLIYTPPANSIDKIDEFDIAIIPDKNFKGRPSNYVDQYKWKVKVRQVANAANASVFLLPDATKSYWSFDKRLEYMRNESNAIYSDVEDISQGILAYTKKDYDISVNGKTEKVIPPTGTRIKFNFVAPKTGEYKIKASYAYQILIYKGIYGIDNEPQQIYSDTHYKPSPVILSTKNGEVKFNLTEGEILPLDIYIFNGTSTGDPAYRYLGPSFAMKMIYNGQEGVVNLADNIFDPTAAQYVQIDDPRKFITDKKYKYKTERFIDYNEIQTSLYGRNTSREVKEADKNSYTFNAISAIEKTKDGQEKNIGFKNIDKALKNDDDSYMEIWSEKNASNPYTYLELQFNATFNKPTNIGSINFFHRTNNWTTARPTKIKILDQDNNVLYDGKYGGQFNDRGTAQSTINFDKVCSITKLTFICSNDTVINNGTDRTCIIFDSITFNDQIKIETNKIVSVQDPSIKPYGNWSYVKNSSGENNSDINDTSIKSTTSGDFMVFDLFAQGFDIVGQKAPTNSNFEVWINDKLVATVDTISSTRQDNQILYSYTSSNNNGEQMRIKIVNKSNKPLYLNYIQTYGKEVVLG